MFDAKQPHAHIFKDDGEHVSASRQDPNGVFLARAPFFRDFYFSETLKERNSILQGARFLAGRDAAMQICKGRPLARVKPWDHGGVL
uniref:Uncharacterized protein n=1 Tax=Candidatus Kentrum sp. SD TaxID=2126332 RepID=A0A451BMV7_9GAMM|nr:MAG: hypothetical protein BECKSD772D_GA0070982_10579 [Candidatus Kentron sp. SD]